MGDSNIYAPNEPLQASVYCMAQRACTRLLCELGAVAAEAEGDATVECSEL